MTDEINANVQHTNDPVVRESLEMAAGVSPSTAISSPRKVSKSVYVFFVFARVLVV